MFDQLSATDFRRTHTMNERYVGKELTSVEDAGNPEPRYAQPPATNSRLVAHWVICVQSGAPTMQWKEA